MAEPSADPIEEIARALRNAASPEPEPWEETVDWHGMAMVVLDVVSPRFLALEAQLAEARAVERERVAEHVRLWLDRTATEWAGEDQQMARWIRTFASGVDREIRALRDPGE